MSVGSLGRSIAAPAADASRVAAIRNKLDLRSPSDIAGFGERARKDVLAGIERLLAEVRANPLGDAADRLKGAQGRIEKLDPSELEPRTPADIPGAEALVVLLDAQVQALQSGRVYQACHDEGR